MQCCDEVTVESYGGILECHPYVLGEYRRIGQCGGRSFYQHKNNTDIFIYYVCGAWYVGLQVSPILIHTWLLFFGTNILETVDGSLVKNVKLCSLEILFTHFDIDTSQ